MALFSKKTKEEEKDEVKSSGVDVVQSPVIINSSFAVIKPRISEKSSMLAKLDKYVFLVQNKANKIEVKKAVEKAYKVHVTQVNIVKNKAKAVRFGRFEGSRSPFKKAIVTLKKGESLETEKAA